MPKIQKKSLINLTAFRQKNGILQKQLADYLKVSRGYISLVESGRSTIAKESIEKIFDNPYHWNVDDLVPAYTRLNAALFYLNNTRNEKIKSEGLPPVNFNINQETKSNIKYGYSEIPEYLVNKWRIIAPELNPEWLLKGEGEMLFAKKDKKPTPIEKLEKKIDNLEAEIKETKTLIEQCKALIEQIPEKVMQNTKRVIA